MKDTGAFDAGGIGQTTVTHLGPGGPFVVVPGGGSLLTAEDARGGGDLRLEGPEGFAVFVRDIFQSTEPMLLPTMQGAVSVSAPTAGLVQVAQAALSDPAILQLAQAATPDPTTVQLAQAATPDPATAIGEVTQITGAVQVTRASGVTEPLADGDLVFQNDILLTGSASTVGIQFIDDTIFALGENAQLTIDQLVFNPGGGGNVLSLSLLQGAFAFVTGRIPPADGPGMTVNTPVAAVGVRGTTGAGIFTAAIQELVVTLLEGLDGILGTIDVANDVSLQTLANALDTLIVNAVDQLLPPPTAATAEQLAAYSLVLNALNLAYLEFLQQEVEPEAGPEAPDGGGAGSGGVGQFDFAGDQDLGNDFGDGSDGGFAFGTIDPDVLADRDPNLVLLIEQIVQILAPADGFPLLIDLDGDNSSADVLDGGSGGTTGFEVVFASIGDAVPIIDGDPEASSDATVTGATITLTNPLDNGDEELLIDDLELPLGIDSTVNEDGTQIVLDGEASVQDYLDALALISYKNESEEPDETDRTITIQLQTPDGPSNTVTATIGFDLFGDTLDGLDGGDFGGPLAFAAAPDDATQLGDDDDDTLIGGSGDDTLIGAGGDDTLTGDPQDGPDVETGSDTFVFSLTDDTGVDVITDFEPEQDVLRITDVIDVGAPGLDIGDLAAAGVTVGDDGTDVTVDLGAGDSVVIQGIGTGGIDSLADLDAAVNLEITA